MNSTETHYQVLKLINRPLPPPQRPARVHIPNAKGSLRVVTEEEIGNAAQAEAEALVAALSKKCESTAI